MSLRKIEEWAMPYVKSFNTYIDIGASIGNTAIPLIDKFKKIIAFEPNPQSFKVLSQEKRIISYCCALGAAEGHATLIVPEKTNDPEHGSIVARRNLNWVGQNYKVELKTLDSYNFTNVNFIKIDVEQGELEVIQGALKTIQQFKPTVMFENKRNENDTVIEIFQSLGYVYKKHKSDTVVYYKD